MNSHVSEINSTFQNAPYNPADYPGIPFADADQLRQNWNDDFAEILVTHHREYCFYTECTNYQATRIFNLEMNRTFTWSDAIANGYANPLQMVNDREYPIGAINNTNIQYSFTPTPSVSDPILAINPTVADALRARLANWDGNDNSLWYWSSQTNQGPTYTAAMQADPNLTVDEIHWMIFRGLYMGAKTQLIRDAQVATCGPFTDDEHTIFQDPVLPNNLNDLSAFIDDNLDFWTEDCVTICENNVAIWLNTYVAKCDLDPLSSDYTQLKTALETYCASADGCSSGNPFGWISQDEVNLVLANDPDASVPLSDLINSINSLGLGCGIEEIWTENTGTEQCETLPAYTTYQLDGCFDSWVNFLNANLFDPSISVSYANYGGVSNFHFDFIDCNNFSCYGGPGSPTETGVIVHGPYLLLDPNLGLPALGVPPTPDATNSYLFYLPNGSVINATDIDEIIGYSIVPIPGGGLTGTLTSGGISRQYKMLELNVQVGGNFETVYLYGPAGCSLVKQINVAAQTICFTIPPTNPVQIDWEQLQTECVNEMMAIAEEQALEEYNRQRGFFFGNVVNEYRSQCENINESFKVTYQSTEHHYTLFYYDQAGNLVQTVPPEGVNPLDATHFNADGVWDGTPTDHSMRTRYVYNSLDELVRQETPDGGTTEFYYDLKGRIVASQDAGQATEGGSNYRAYNYTNYDAQGRPVEAGEVRVSPSSALSGLIEAEQDLVLNDGNFPATVGTLWNSLSRREVTQTHYDDALALGHVTQEMGNGAQQYLRNRVSHITNEQYYDGDPLTYDHATHYNYDPHGNVDILLQEQTRLSSMGHALKRVEYDYDLLTGNVNELAYQDGKDDQYYHQYEYDADNRITIAYSGTHREHLEQEAKYFYHLHGPLARTEIGHDKVQAIDQAYTIHGWRKGSNAESLNYLRDIGRDGDQTNSDNRNQLVGQDAFGYSLRYYGNDYTSIGFTNFLAAEPTAPTWAEWDLFNGNIKAMTTALSNYNEAPMQVLRNHYRYDELHRLKEMRAHIAHTDLRDLNTWDNTTASNEYHVTVSYDANGNINNLSRNGNQTDGLPMDRLRYHYIDGTNQLEYVDDNHPVAPATASVYTRDLEDQSIGNYAYDATGQLIQDNQEEIESIEWTASGKVRAVNRTASSTKPNLYFEYDALDNRILKLVKPRDGGVLSNEGDWVYTHYVRDGEGNLLATYEQT
ncbi:MAG: RHS repeat domain-containing protein, partial [Salibacteraceae bacterium]